MTAAPVLVLRQYFSRQNAKTTREMSSIKNTQLATEALGNISIKAFFFRVIPCASVARVYVSAIFQTVNKDYSFSIAS